MKQIFFLTLRILVACVFIVSGFMKLMEPSQNFLAVIYEYKILFGWPAKVFAVSMPWAELIFGAFLLKGLWTRFSIAALWFLNCVFIAALGSALWRKLPITECGCFGGGKTFPLDKILMVDVALWFVFALLFIFSKYTRRFGLDEI